MTKLHHAKCQAGHGRVLEQMYKNWVDSEPTRSVFSRKAGPGTQLYRLLRDGWGMTTTSCTCAEWIARMNMWGYDECRARIEEVVDHLLNEARNNPMVPRAIRAALNFPLIGEVAGRLRLRSLVQTAIDKIPEKEYETIEDPLGNLPILKGPAVSYRDQHLNALAELAKKTWPAPDTFNGDGVLIVGGGKYWPGIVVSIRMLRKVGCDLPVQVWYRGEQEPVDAADLDGVSGVTLINTIEYADKNGGYRMMGGWESKLYALTHSNFRRVLYLDADAYVVADPTPMMQRLDEAPFLFWQDLPGNNNSVKWQWVWPDLDAGVPCIQGGQLFIDLSRCWDVVQIAHWMNQHADFYYQYMYGDQDTWRVAFAAVNKPELWKNLGNAPWVNDVSFLLPDTDGRPLIIHRCRGKLFLPQDIPDRNTQYSNPRYELPYESEVFTMLAGVKSRALPPRETFDAIYRKQLWGIGSGAGSAPQESMPYIDFVYQFMREHSLSSILDLGCGDGRVASNFQFPYVGVDVHEDQLIKLRLRYPEKQWLCADIHTGLDNLPAADVLLCKDVLHHWPNEMIRHFLDEIVRLKKWKAVLLCQDYNQVQDGADCPLGTYRALNPSMHPLAPYNLVLEYRFLHKAVLSLPLENTSG